MFVVYVGSILTTGLWSSRRWSGTARRRPGSSWRLGLALVHRPVRQLRRGDGRRARQGAGRCAAAHAPRRAGQATRTSRSTARRHRAVSGSVAAEGRRRARRGGRHRFPATAKSSKASPRSTRAPSPARARRSSARAAATAARSPAARASSPTGWSCAITAEPGRDLPRPHDRDGRRGEAAEDAERDRAQHPARGD